MTKRTSPKKASPRPGHKAVLVSSVCIVLIVLGSAGACIATAYSNQQMYAQLEVRQAQYLAIEQEQSVLARAQDFWSDGHPFACINLLAETSGDWFPEWSQWLATECNRPVADQWIQQAKTHADNGEFAKAIEMLLQISGEPFRSEAQPMIDTWSQNIYDLASERYNQAADHLPATTPMLRKIPPESRLFDQAQQTIEAWHAEWSDNHHYLKLAHDALNNGDTCGARASLDAVSKHPAWHERQAQTGVRIQQQEYAYETVLQQAAQLVDNGEYQAAQHRLAKLPDKCRWLDQKRQLNDVIQTASTPQAPPRQRPWWVLVGVPFLLTRQGRGILLTVSKIWTDHS